MATVLIVDDLADHRQYLGAVVTRAGHAFLEAADGAEALALVRSERPELVITDLLMGSVDGVEFVKRLRADPAVARTPVVFCSAAYHHAEIENLRVGLGVCAVLLKPVRVPELRELLARTLGGASAPVAPPAAVADAGALAATNRRLMDVIDLGQKLSRTLDPRDVLDALAGAARTLVGARAAMAAILAEDRRTCRAHAVAGPADRALAEVAGAVPESGPIAELARGSAAVRTRDAFGVRMTSPAFPDGFLFFQERAAGGPFGEADEQLAALLAAIGAAAFEKSMLLAEAQRRARDLAVVSQRLVRVQEDERRRLARELHDEVGQLLTGLKLELEGLARRWPDAGREMTGVLGSVTELIGRTRDLSLELRPAILDDFGLVPALLWLIGRFQDQTGIAVSFDHSGLEARLSSEIETAAYRIVQEALTNVARHAGVDEAWASVVRHGAALEVEVRDQGRGFDSAAPRPPGASSGLSGMVERAAMLGGRLVIESAEHEGTQVLATLPIEAAR